jgi:glycine/D-amino acid oxidase-like deaminating enzyme
MPAAEVVICGAGIAGAAAAYHLAVRQRVPNVVIVDAREPLTLTSDKGTMGYRNWFDGPDDTMARFVGRSVSILEEMADECGNAFQLSRPGYAFVTADAGMLERLRAQARRLESFGAGAVREHPGSVPYTPVTGSGGPHADRTVATVGDKHIIHVEIGQGEGLRQHLASHGIEAIVSPTAETDFERVEISDDVDLEEVQTILDNWTD